MVIMASGIAPDHKSVFLNIEVKTNSQGAQAKGNLTTPYWKTKDKDLIEFYYPPNLNKYSEVVDKQLLWVLIKMKFRAKT